MLTPTSNSVDSFVDILRPSQGYSLSDVRLDIPNPTTAIFKAKLNGPQGTPVWARAWLSTEAGTLAETASNAYMRIESAPLKTEHVVVLRLT